MELLVEKARPERKGLRELQAQQEPQGPLAKLALKVATTNVARAAICKSREHRPQREGPGCFHGL